MSEGLVMNEFLVLLYLVLTQDSTSCAAKQNKNNLIRIIALADPGYFYFKGK